METQTRLEDVMDRIGSAKDATDILRRRLPPGWIYAAVEGAGDGVICLSRGAFDFSARRFRWERSYVLTPYLPGNDDVGRAANTSGDARPPILFRVTEIVAVAAAGSHDDGESGGVIGEGAWSLGDALKVVDPTFNAGKTDDRVNDGSVTEAVTSSGKTAAAITPSPSRKRRSRYKAEGHPVGRKFSASFDCKLCGESFRFDSAFVQFGLHERLLAHCHQKHRRDGRKTAKKRGHFRCRHCEKTFSFEYLLKRHEAGKHDVNNYKPTKTDKGEFVCKICDKVLSQLRHLERHVRLVHEALPDHRPFVCEVCGKAFKTKFNLSKHHKTHQERPFKCNQCGAAFCAKCELSYHEIIHTGEKPFLCQQCGKGFNTKTYLHQHQVKVCKVKKSSAAVGSKPTSESKPVLSPPLPPPHVTSNDASATSLASENEAALAVELLVNSESPRSNSILQKAEVPTASAATAIITTTNAASAGRDVKLPSSVVIDQPPSLQQLDSSQSRDALFAPTSVSWQIVQATNGDHSHQHLHHLIHHPASASSLASMTASIPASMTASISVSSLASMTASMPASSLAPLAASVPASLPGPMPLDNHSDIPVHDLPDSSENHHHHHHHHLYSIPSIASTGPQRRLPFSAPNSGQSQLDHQGVHVFRGPFDS